MLYRIYEKYINPIRCAIKSVTYKKIDNDFVKDLLVVCKTYGRKYDIFISIVSRYEAYLNQINQDLYLYLNEEDRNTFIRFLLKAFYGINTATKSELLAIDAAFDKARDIYQSKPGGGVCEI